MLLRIPLFLLIFAFHFSSYSQNGATCNTFTSQRAYGTPADDLATWAIQQPDGSIMTLGWSNTKLNNPPSKNFSKRDINGDPAWSMAYDKNIEKNANFHHFNQTSDGGSIACGYITATPGDRGDALLMKMDGNGAMSWARRYRSQTIFNNDEINAVLQTSDNGYICAGRRPLNTLTDLYELAISRMDQNGTVLWTNTFDMFQWERVYSMIEDGNSIVACGNYNTTVPEYTSFVIKFDKLTGQTIWTKYYNIPVTGISFFGIHKTDQGYLLNGGFENNVGLKYLCNIDNNGNVMNVLQANLPGYATSSPLLITHDKNILITFNRFGQYPVIARISDKNELVWSKSIITGSHYGKIINLFEAKDYGTYGTGDIYNGKYFDQFFVKTDAAGDFKGCVTSPVPLSLAPATLITGNLVWNRQTLKANVYTSSFPITVSYEPLVLSDTLYCKNCTDVCVIPPECNSFRISGPDTICSVKDTVTYSIAACSKSATWEVDPGIVNIISRTDSTIQLNFLRPGKTFLYASNTGYCKLLRDSLLIEVFSFPEKFLADKKDICKGSTTELNAIGDWSSYKWYNNAVTSSVSVDAPGQYWLQVTNEAGCVARDTISLIEKDCINKIYFPNAFSPGNSRGYNRFKPVINGQPEKYRFIIYNRWGVKIFETTDPLQGWDGNYKGKNQEIETFVWMCSYNFHGEPQKTEKGTVMLIR